jgi:alanyl-tRNA synthetase
VIALVVDQKQVQRVEAGQSAELVLDQTPFYAETGGQVGDRGVLADAGGETVAEVSTAYPAVAGLTSHKIRALKAISVGDQLQAHVAEPERASTRRNHTATHLLHAALRDVLGPHVKQAGSVVEPPRLRFDFSHYAGLDRAEIAEIERIVNHQIRLNTPVTTDVLPIEQALATGAMALFGEKYGDEVRVVSIPGFSKELCGGTHVTRAGDIGVFKIVSEGSISAGVRRIEAVTGEEGVARFQKASDAVSRLAQTLRVAEPELVEQIEKTLTENRSLERQVDQLKHRIAQASAGDLERQATDVKGVKVLAARVDGMDRAQMRAVVDTLRNKWKSAVVVIGSVEDGAVSIVAGVTKDTTAKVQAGKLVSQVAMAVGGKGGGRPDLAEGGGKDPAALSGALDAVREQVQGILQGS